MRFKLRSFDYHSLIKYLMIFILFLFFNKIENDVYPYSIAVYSSVIATRTNPIISSILLILSFICLGEFGYLLSMTICVAVFTIIFYLYKKYRLKTIYEFVIYTAFSLIGYLLLGNTIKESSFDKRLIVCSITILLNIITLITLKSIEKKGIKSKYTQEEYISIALFIVSFGIGLSNLISPLVYKCIAIFIILILSYLLPNSLSITTSAILGITLSIYYGNLSHIATFLAMGIIAFCFMNISKYASCLSIIVSDILLQYFFKTYSYFGLFEILSTTIGAILFIIIPSKILTKIKDQLLNFKDKILVRQTINRNRLYLSNRLYEISSIFSEMSSAFNSFTQIEVNQDSFMIKAKKKVLNDVCETCEYKYKCQKNKNDIITGIDKVTEIGFAKGRLSLIDFPSLLTENCSRPSDIIFCLNKYLSEYKKIAVENNNLKIGREMFKNEADGISEILKSLALESGEMLKYHGKLEKELNDILMKNGIFAQEILIYGENKGIKVSLILTTNEYSIYQLTSIISSKIGFEVMLYEKNNITENKICLSFRSATKFDAVFGVSNTAKDKSSISGDTFSINKINNGKFLVALSDGMGSGEKAQTVSAVSLSLIESFYKAGMDSDVILSSVNKLLALYTEDTFTALDVSVIDLNNCSADFIKYGSPYGFIINNSGVKIVEGNSLPLGIINELKPSVCKTQLNDGDIILLVSDGISDSFSSSGDFIEYLRKIPARNPQTLTDTILKKAISNNNGIKKDDMTAVAVRLFKK